jgi:hypothetical protein
MDLFAGSVNRVRARCAWPWLRRFDDVGCGIGELVGVGFARWLFGAASFVFLVAVAQAVVSTATVDFGHRSRPRCDGACSGAGGRSFGCVQECGFSPAVPLFELLRVLLPAPAGGAGLTAGSNRGVAPADGLLSGSRSRRPRRVTSAAISTRLSPPKVRAGDPAAAWCGVVFLSGGATAAVRAAADSLEQKSFQGPSCYFLVCQGLFCIVGTAVPVLDVSCITVFLA